MEFLYVEEDNFLFLDIGNLDQVFVSPKVIGNKVNFLKEGVEIKAFFYGDTIFNIEFLYRCRCPNSNIHVSCRIIDAINTT